MRETALSTNPDIILLNGKIFTGSTSLGFVEALAIAGEKLSPSVRQTKSKRSRTPARARSISKAAWSFPASTMLTFITCPTPVSPCCRFRTWNQVGMRSSMR